MSAIQVFKKFALPVLSLVAVSCGDKGKTEPEEKPQPYGYEVKVNGQAVEVLSCRVSAVPFNQVWAGYQRPVDQTEIACHTAFDMPETGSANVEVTVAQTIGSVKLNPSWKGVTPQVDGQKVSFTLTGNKAHNLTLEINGTHHALHILASPKETDIPQQGAVTHYYGPGVHRPGRVKLATGSKVYVAPGAVVFGNFYAVNASDIRVYGRGVIDGSQQARGTGSGLGFSGCTNVSVEGIILRDPPMWCCTFFGCTGVTVDNVKIVGLWRYNSDGIDLVNSSDVVVKNCFVRAFDDCLTVKGLKVNSAEPEQIQIGDKSVDNVTVQNCVFWCDWGRAMVIGAETYAPTISNVTFKDIDVIRVTDVFMDILHGNKAAVSDILYENINAGIDAYTPAPVFQTAQGQTYSDPGGDYVPKLMSISIAPNGWLNDGQLGTVDRVTYKNVTVRSDKRPASEFKGYSTTYRANDITVDNLVIGGAQAVGATTANLTVGQYVYNVQFP